MSRELRARARARIQPDTDDESDDADEEESSAQIPASSIQDLVNPADAQQFDQTFSDADANLNIEGAFDPTAGDKQVIPRIAFVLNFNLVYNEAQERWEPDTGNESGGVNAQSSVLEKTSDQSLPTNNVQDTITFQQTGADGLGAASPSNNQISIPATGTYLLTGSVLYDDYDAGADLDARIDANGSRVIGLQATANDGSAGVNLTDVSTKPVALDSGDTIDMQASADNTSAATVKGDPPLSFLSVTRLS